MLIILTLQLIQSIMIIWFCHRSTAADAVYNDLGAARIHNCQVSAEADPSLWLVEETTRPSDEKVSTNTDTIRGARQHSLMTQSVAAWVDTTVQ
jgi:hypothetical protein